MDAFTYHFMDKSSELSQIPLSTPVSEVSKILYGSLGNPPVGEHIQFSAGGEVLCLKDYIGTYYRGYAVTRCNCGSCDCSSKVTK